MAKIPRKLSLVRFDPRGIPKATRRQYPFRDRVAYVFLGEIVNMSGHCVVADQKSGKIYSGYHTELFVELQHEEV
jgi:hypothetical protein